MNCPAWFIDYECACYRGADDRAVALVMRGVVLCVFPIPTWDGVDGEHAEPTPTSIAVGIDKLEPQVRREGTSVMRLGDLLAWASRRSDAEAVDIDSGETYRRVDTVPIEGGVFDRRFVREALQPFVEARVDHVRCAVVPQNGGTAFLVAAVEPRIFAAVMSLKPGEKPKCDDALVLP